MGTATRKAQAAMQLRRNLSSIMQSIPSEAQGARKAYKALQDTWIKRNPSGKLGGKCKDDSGLINRTLKSKGA